MNTEIERIYDGIRRAERRAQAQRTETAYRRAPELAALEQERRDVFASAAAKRLGAENVYIIYRRGMAELPARKEEVEHAEEEGIIFHTLTNPVEILPTDVTDPRDPNYGWVAGIRCVKMELGEPDASGRRSPIVIEGSEFDIPMDCVIMSLGTSPNPLLKATTPGLETQKRGQIIADEHGLTSIEGVYAGGDAVTGAATVILAMGAGKTAAAAIDKYIQEKK